MFQLMICRNLAKCGPLRCQALPTAKSPVTANNVIRTRILLGATRHATTNASKNKKFADFKKLIPLWQPEKARMSGTYDQFRPMCTTLRVVYLTCGYSNGFKF